MYILALFPMQCYDGVAEVETFGEGCVGQCVGNFFGQSPFKLSLNAVESALSLNERHQYIAFTVCTAL